MTARPIANIIGYLGNLDYHGMDQEFLKLDYTKLLRHTKSKEFVMVITGLLKLNLHTKCLDFSVKDVIMKKVDYYFEIGELISLWRNAIKFNESDD